MPKDDWRIKGGRRKGKKALKYADLLWGDERKRKITLADLCRCWNLDRLLKEGELQRHINGKALSKLIQYLMAITLVQNAKFCTCKEIFSFFKYDLPKLKDRDRKNPRPLEHYQKQASYLAIPYIQKALTLLQNKEQVQKTRQTPRTATPLVPASLSTLPPTFLHLHTSRAYLHKSIFTYSACLNA
jgi:hypothetical protein